MAMLPEIPLPPNHPHSRLGDLLPADDPNSPWLFRLWILRDDIDFEVRGLAMEGDAEPIKVWENFYFLRRLAVSICEVRNVWRKEVPTNLAALELATEEHAEMERVSDIIERTAEALQPLRDALGGHVRLTNAVEGPDKPTFEERCLRNFADWTGPIAIGVDNPRLTTFRGLTSAALPAILGHDDTSKLQKWHEDLDILSACGNIMAAIVFLAYRNAPGQQANEKH